ncbi:MAG: FAD-binding oxidoreductase [Symploca sp. SIO1C4]|uniref:FAD-binding oxidoreductase n=1 Tax=Symploca sp. SIO1C4 TaxID=2607765 RepID=A0A6B3NB81_9CYAN|nr:FAD-binding oxidoreductase [Symploca sp. SIO1C4]
MKAIAQELESIVSNSGVCQWDSLEPNWQETLGRINIPDNLPSTIIYPSSAEELAQVINCAHRHSWSVIPCGNGSKLSWGGVGKKVELIVSSKRLNRVIEHAVSDLTVTAEAGVKFADLQEILLKTGQFLPLEPAYPQEATLGGIIATADSGSWRQRYGGVRDMLLGISFVRYDGQIVKAGSRVVKNVAGYDLMKLLTGSYGTLGMITQVTLRVYPLPETSATVVLTGKAEAIASATKTLLASALTPTAVDLLSTQLAAQLGIGQGIGLMVRFQSVSESVKEQSSRLLEVGQQLGLKGTLYVDAQETNLWQSLPKQIWITPQTSAITCKIGVLPTAAVNTLTKLETLTSSSVNAYIHAGSGIGHVRLDPITITPQTIMELRHYCQAQNGFFTILEAPISWKQQLDVWGYNGNALEIMRNLKQKFDPKNLFSPQRFVGGI